MTWSDFISLFPCGLLAERAFVSAGAVHLHSAVSSGTCHFMARITDRSAPRMAASEAAHTFPGFNASSAMAFLAWFGGTGYLLTRHSHLLAVVSLLIATVAGLAAGFVVFRFMVKLVSSDDAPMKSEDYRMEGSLGTISMPIRESGTGEIIFSWQEFGGAPERAAIDGKPSRKAPKVVIERYEKGIAYVKRWEEFTK